MFIYILIEEEVNDFEIDKKAVTTYSSLENANAQVKFLANQWKNTNFIDDFVIEDETITDQPLKSFEAWEDGFYARNHYILTLYQREI
jgi:hypothetical protein